MTSDNQNQLSRILILLDLLSIVGAYFLAFWLFFYVFPKDSIFGGTFSLVTAENYKSAILYIAPLTLVIYGLLHLYHGIRFTGRRKEFLRVLQGNAFSVITVVLFFWLFIKPYSTHFSRMFLAEFGILCTVLVILVRNLFRTILSGYLEKNSNKRHILLVGYSKAAEALLERLKLNYRGFAVEGILDDFAPVGTRFLNVDVIGGISMLPEILSENRIGEVYVTLPLSAYGRLSEVVRTCEKAGVQTKFVPDYGRLMSSRPYTEDMNGLPVIYVRRVPLHGMLNAALKRTEDLVGSAVAIVLFSPVMLITALLVKCTSKGPLIFKQERIGRNNKPFMMYKFRSMVVQTDAEEEKGWTTKNDARITPFGKFIRRTSIDELPQLFNVFLGSMSLVGPRPERPQFVEKFKEEIPKYMVKHQVRPGMTGWAQVNGYRGDTSIEKRIEYDIHYIENWSLGFDLRILLLTVFKGFVNKNAY